MIKAKNRPVPIFSPKESGIHRLQDSIGYYDCEPTWELLDQYLTADKCVIG